MANTVYNVAKSQAASGAFDLENDGISALLLATAGVGYDDPDLGTVAALLAVGGTAEPAAGERVVVGARTLVTSAANDRAEVSIDGAVSFAADAGESCVAIVFYATAGNALISVHDFAQTGLDGGIDFNDDANGFLRIA